jgi:hypothetical protein
MLQTNFLVHYEENYTRIKVNQSILNIYLTHTITISSYITAMEHTYNAQLYL